MTIVSIGEILWDVFPGSEKLGGAPFNFSVHAARLGARVAFVSAVGDDVRGRTARARVRELGLDDAFIAAVPGAATGTVSVHVDAAGQPDFTIHRPAAYDAAHLDDAALARLAALRPDWLYFGTLHQSRPGPRALTRRLIEVLPHARRFYDVNLRRDSWTPQLIRDLLAEAHAVKLNEHEAHTLGALPAVDALAVTRGANGCTVRIGADEADVTGYTICVADTVGSGDAFAAAFLHGLAQGWTAARTGDFANRVGALVASRPGGVPEWTVAEALALRRPCAIL